MQVDEATKIHREGSSLLRRLPQGAIITVEELTEFLCAEKGAIVPAGAGTQTYFGNPLRTADCAVDLTRLSRITAYNPADLTIHLQAGVTLGQLISACASAIAVAAVLLSGGKAESGN